MPSLKGMVSLRIFTKYILFFFNLLRAHNDLGLNTKIQANYTNSNYANTITQNVCKIIWFLVNYCGHRHMMNFLVL
jgi:hypothetical protein